MRISNDIEDHLDSRQTSSTAMRIRGIRNSSSVFFCSTAMRIRDYRNSSHRFFAQHQCGFVVFAIARHFFLLNSNADS